MRRARPVRMASSILAGCAGGHRRADSARPEARSRRRTLRTWTGSALCDAHMIASRSSGMSRPIRRRLTAACSGLVEDRENTRRCGSPSEARTVPLASQTAMWPRWMLSTTPGAHDADERERRGHAASLGEGQPAWCRARLELLVVVGRIVLDHADEHADDVGIPLRARPPADLGEGALDADRTGDTGDRSSSRRRSRPPRRSWPRAGSHRPQAVGVALAVEALVVVADQLDRLGEEGDRRNDLRADDRDGSA